MKKIHIILLAVLALVAVSNVGFAQRGFGDRSDKPGNGNTDRPTDRVPCGIFQTDSCLRMFLSSIPDDDAATVVRILSANDELMTNINRLMAAIRQARADGDIALARRLAAELKNLNMQLRDNNKMLRRLVSKYAAEYRRASMACCPKRKGSDRPGGGNTDTKPDMILHVAPLMPNPVTGGITEVGMKYGLKLEAVVTVSIHDQIGNVVKKFDLGTHAAGEYSTRLDISGLVPGGYHVRVQANDAVNTQRLMIAR